MHISKKILDEIVELSEIKKAYNHYLCTCDSKQDVENYTYIISNKAIVSYYLNSLYTKLVYVQQKLERRKSVTKRYTYNASKTEQRAIMHFYSDKRFKITE